MIRIKLFIAASALAVSFAASPVMATVAETGTANGATTTVVTQATFTNLVGNASGPSSSRFIGRDVSRGSGPGEQDGFNFDRDGLRVSQSGASAGGNDGKLAIWVQGSYATFDQDQVQIAADGDTYSIAAGGDWQFSDRFIGGLSLSGYTSDATLTFNNGTLETDGVVVAPYFAAILGKNRNFILDGAVGYGVGESDATRSNGTITGSYDSSVWFASTNLTYQKNYRNFSFAPKVGVLWLDSSNDGYTEAGGVAVAGSDSQLGRLSFGGKVSYIRNPKFIPFFSAIGEYDFETEDYSAFTAGNRPSVEDTGATLGLGAQMALSERLSGSVEGTTAVGRDDYSAYTLSGSLRLKF
jgi:outer membrane autotransporter protein